MPPIGERGAVMGLLSVGALVLNARPSDVDDVLVDGRVVKRGAPRRRGLAELRTRILSSSPRIIEGARQVDSGEIASFASYGF